MNDSLLKVKIKYNYILINAYSEFINRQQSSDLYISYFVVGVQTYCTYKLPIYFWYKYKLLTDNTVMKL